MSSLHTMAIVFMAALLLFFIIIGFWAGKKNKTGTLDADVEYFLGGKSTPTFVLGMSYCASAVSAGSFIGDPGVMSTVGWPYYWIPVTLVPGLVITGIWIIRKFRLQAEKYGSMTITDYISDRFHAPWLKTYLTILMTLCYLFMLISQFKGCAVLLNMYTGIPFNAGLVVMLIVCIFFVNIGGLRSVAWTDFFQGCFMVVMSAMLVIVAICAVGGFSGMEESLAQDHPTFNQIVEHGSESDVTVSWIGAVTIPLFGFFIMSSQPYVAARYIALPDINRKRIGKFLFMSLGTGLIFNAMFLVGLCGRILIPDGEADYMTVAVSVKLFPSILACIIMLGFFSAILSTATSILLVMGQSIGGDLYGKFSKKSTPKKEVRVTQISTLVIGLIVLIFNLINPPEFLQIFVYLGVTGVGSSIVMPLFCGVLWKKVSRMGVILSSFVGPAFYLFWSQLLHLSWFSGMGLSVLAAAVVTFGWTWIENAIKGPDKELMEWADPFIDAPASYDPTTNRD